MGPFSTRSVANTVQTQTYCFTVDGAFVCPIYNPGRALPAIKEAMRNNETAVVLPSYTMWQVVMYMSPSPYWGGIAFLSNRSRVKERASDPVTGACLDANMDAKRFVSSVLFTVPLLFDAHSLKL